MEDLSFKVGCQIQKSQNLKMHTSRNSQTRTWILYELRIAESQSY